MATAARQGSSRPCVSTGRAYDFKRLFTISEYYDRDRMAFYRALQSVRRTNMDMTGWIEFFAIGLATQLAEVKRRGELAIQQDILARRRDLTDRQVLALRHVPQATILNAGHDSGSMPWCFR
jgi:Fic family protein